jgi:hypothetical protein
MTICADHWHRNHIGPCYSIDELMHATRARLLMSEVIAARTWRQRHRIWRHSVRLHMRAWLPVSKPSNFD